MLPLVVEDDHVYCLSPLCQHLRFEPGHIKVSQSKTRLGDLIRWPFSIIRLWSILMEGRVSRSVTRQSLQDLHTVCKHQLEESEWDAMSQCVADWTMGFKTKVLWSSLVRGHYVNVPPPRFLRLLTIMLTHWVHEELSTILDEQLLWPLKFSGFCVVFLYL